MKTLKLLYTYIKISGQIAQILHLFPIKPCNPTGIGNSLRNEHYTINLSIHFPELRIADKGQLPSL